MRHESPRYQPASTNRKLASTLVFVLGLYAVAAPLATAQTFSVVHSFAGGSDGANPLGGLYIAGEYLYGTTSSGGSSGLGVVFRLTTSGQETVLHEFSGGTDGASPEGHLAYRNGYFYGTTTAGGVSNAGTVFKVSTKGVETVLYSFTGNADGAKPVAGMAIDKFLAQAINYFINRKCILLFCHLRIEENLQQQIAELAG